MSDQDIVSHLKGVESLMERSVSGNQQIHSLLEQLINRMDRIAASNERCADFLQKSWEAYSQLPKK